MRNGLDRTSWNLHRVDIDDLPRLDLNDTDKLQWLGGHATFMMSQRERSIMEGSARKDATVDDLIDVKASLHLILTTATGNSRPLRSVFALREQGNNNLKALIFIAGLRLDLPAHTVVVDAFVLTMDQEYLKTIAKPLRDLSTSIFGVNVSPQELEVWQRLLPAAAERCRRWKHEEDCPDKQVLLADHPLLPCQCGRGHDIATFKERQEWEAFAPYVTRVAISPLFAVSYLDPI